ncbi:MAG: hypothetical protein EA398_06690 [Deltaproteobacteria bacterium]|nr:MAG: hypothetical protein EA398_06690 [Deltaproteobacteria bacterium]
MSRTTPGAIIHRNLSIIACDTSATLQETLHHLADVEAELVRIGERHIALPSSHLDEVLSRLRATGQFPRLVGAPPGSGEAEEGAIADDGEES